MVKEFKTINQFIWKIKYTTKVILIKHRKLRIHDNAQSREHVNLYGWI